MKKNRLLFVALAALTVGALASCQPKIEDVPPVNTDVPTEEGKVTFYFTDAEGSVALDRYASYWLTGGFNGFATGTTALEMTKMEGDSRVYYVITDAPDTTKTQGFEYQIVKGYNASSSMPADKQGLAWNNNYKSDEELALEAMENPVFEFTAGDKTIDLGTHTFSTSVLAPASPLTNYTLKFTFTESVPTWSVPIIMGSMNGWKTPSEDNTEEENKAIVKAGTLKTTDEARKVWTITYASIYAGSYEYKLLVEYTTAVSSVTWNVVDQTKENTPLNIMQADGDNYELDLGEVSMDFGVKMPDPSKAYDYVFIFENATDGGALVEGVEPGICGDFTSWKYTAMTKVGEHYELAIRTVYGTKGFGIINMKEGGTNWVGCIVDSATDNNISAVLEEKNQTITVVAKYSELGQGTTKHHSTSVKITDTPAA